MAESSRIRGRWLLWALPVWALMLLIGTWTHQPDPQTQFAAFADYITTDWFLASHLINSILGAAIGSIGFIGLMLYLSGTRAAGRSTAASIAMVAGNTLSSAVFGAAAFAQPAIGRIFQSGSGDALALYNDVYSAPLFATAILGLLLLMAGGVLAGAAISAAGRLPRWLGWLLALSTVVFTLSVFWSPAQTPACVGLLVATTGVAWFGSKDNERSAQIEAAPL